MGNSTNLGYMLENGKVIVWCSWAPCASMHVCLLTSLLFHFPMPWC